MLGGLRSRFSRRVGRSRHRRLLLRQDVADAIATYRPIFEARQAALHTRGITLVFHSLEDAIERSSALVGSPQQIIEKVHRYHEQLGHEELHVNADGAGLTTAQHRATLELFQSQIAPIMRREIPSRPFPPALA